MAAGAAVDAVDVEENRGARPIELRLVPDNAIKGKLIDTEGRVERFTKRFGVQTIEGRKKQATANKEAKVKGKTKKAGATA